MQHELFEELEAFDPRWQQHYPRIIDAATAADVLDLYAAWTKTQAGLAYQRSMTGVEDARRDDMRNLDE